MKVLPEMKVGKTRFQRINNVVVIKLECPTTMDAGNLKDAIWLSLDEETFAIDIKTSKGNVLIRPTNYEKEPADRKASGPS